MKEKIGAKLNKKSVGIFIIVLTVLYILVTTIVAQNDKKKAGTGIEYEKDYLSYGDVWAFNQAAHTASNYSKSNLGSSSFYSNSSNTNNGTTNFTRSFYKEVTTTERGAPTGTTVPSHAFTRFVNGTSNGTVTSSVDSTQTIPVITTNVANNSARYSVVPDTAGDYFVYVYSESGTPTVNYAMLDSCDASIAYGEANGVPNTPLVFEEVGNNWYRAPIEVKTVRWHAVALNDPKKSGSSNSPSGVGTYTGGQDFNTDLTGGGTTYYYNQWTTTNVDYNTVIVFQFTSAVKLGPVTKNVDTITINNPSSEKGNVFAYTIFGEKIEIGSAVKIPHCPVIISGEANGAYMLDEVKVEKGSGQIEASGENYLYPFEDTSEISVSWTKLVKLPEIAVTGGTDDVTMNFFGAKTATIEHPGVEERTYTFTADFEGASDLALLNYSYTITDSNKKTITESGALTQSSDSFSVSNACYDSIVVTFTAVDKDGERFTATCTINLATADAISAPFKVDSKYYWTWEKAVAAARTSNSRQVILINDYTMPDDLYGNGLLENGTYAKVSGERMNYDLPTVTLSSGITFIVPYAEVYNYSTGGNHPYACEAQPITYESGIVAIGTKVYVELTVPSDASINVQNCSVMAVGGTTDGACKIYDAHSNIHLDEGAEINVASGARLSSCGYIYGEGTVNAKSNSTIYMPFSVMDFRGGGYTVGAAGKLSTSYGLTPLSGEGSAISPFLRYTMNAIQCELVVEQGATVTGYVDLVAQSEHNSTYATIIGTSDGLIQTKNATLTITYDANTYASSYSMVGRTKIVINGDASFGNLDLAIKTSLGNAKIDTSKVNFPVPYNYDIEIESGTFTIPNKIMLLPGARVAVSKGATLVVNNNAWLTIYDGLHDYTSSGDSSGHMVMEGYKSSNSNDTITKPYIPYPSTSVLQGASFGGSGSADLIVNGTLDLQSGAIGGIIQTGGDAGATIKTASGIKTSTKTQVGLTGSYNAVIQSSYFAGATVRELQGEILDTGTGKRTKLVADRTYYAAAGTGNISSYTYTLYYSSRNATSSYSATLTDEVACILQGSWWNYEVTVHTVLNRGGTMVEVGTAIMRFADGADVSAYYTNLACTSKAGTVSSSTKDLYFNAGDAEAMIVHEGDTKDNGIYYLTVRNAVQEAVNGDTIYLLKDLKDFSSVIGPRADQDFIFDMDGHTINYRSTPFVSTSGGKITIYLREKGTITNKVGDKYYDSPVLMVTEGSTLYLYLDGGTISVTGGNGTALVNGGVENGGTLYIDLGGGKWEYKTGLVVPKASNDAGTQHHNLTVLSPYKSKAMFNNTGTLTITDKEGGGTIITDLISDGTTLTATTPTTNFVSVIRNNVGATLYLGGGTLVLEPKGDEKGDAILSTAATPIPMAVYSAVILNFGDIYACDEGTALSMIGSGSYVLYNMKGGTVDLDLRGGTLELAEYEKGTAEYRAMYNGKYVVINDGEMTLRSSDGQGKIIMSVKITTGALNGILNSNNAAIFSTLTLDGIDIEVLHSASATSYGVYNRAGSTITGIKNTNITMVLGQALNSTGSATTTTTIGDIINSTFTVSKRYASEDGTVTAVTGSNAVAVSYTDIGHIKDSEFSSVDAYAFNATSGSTIKSITGGSFKSTASGGLNLGSLQSAQTYQGKAAKVGDITRVDFEVHTIGINAAGAQASAYGKAVGPEIGNIIGCTFKTNTGNGMTIAGAAGNATFPAHAFATVGDITGNTVNSGTIGISLSYAHAGVIEDCRLTSTALANNNGVIHIINYSSVNYIKNTDIVIKATTTGTQCAGIYLANSTVNGGITGGSITAEKGYGITAAGTAENKTNGTARILAVIGDITGLKIDALSIGMNLSHTQLGDLDHVTITTKTSNGINATNGCVIGDITDCKITSGEFDEATGTYTTGGVGLSTAGAAPTATADVLVPKVGNIIRSKFYAKTQGISIAGQAANATYNTAIAYATMGDITDSTFVTGTNGISISYCKIGKIEGCELTSTSIGNNQGVIHSANFSSIECLNDVDITTNDMATATHYGIYNSISTIGDVTDCEITISKGYAFYNASNSTGIGKIGDINGCTIISTLYGGINASGTAENTSTGVARALAVFGDIVETTFTVQTVGMNLSHTELGNLDHVTITTKTGNGITAASSEIGDITDCEITSGTINEETGKFTTGALAISNDGAQASATANVLRGQIGNITDTVLKGKTGGISNANGSIIGDLTRVTIESDAYGINMTSRAGNAYADAVAPTIGNLTKVTINAGTYGIQAAGAAAATANLTVGNETVPVYRGGVAPTIGNLTGVNINAGSFGMNITSAGANTYGVGAGAVVGKIDDCKVNATTYGISIAGGAGTLAEKYQDVGFATVGDITGTTVNSGTYSIYFNYCKGGVIEDCELNATSPAANANVNFALGNLNGSEITRIVNTPIKVTAPAAKVYGIYNNGGEIGLIEKSPIDAPYGIYNANTRSSTSTAASGEFVVYAGRIGTIKDTDITVAQYAIANRGVIDEIIGKCTFIASNPSAQVPEHAGTYAVSNAAAYTICNYNTWWADQTLWRRTDTYDSEGHLIRTDEYLMDDAHRPTIGKISGEIQIIALNTSTTANNGQNNGVALYNAGIINEISGNVLIDTHVHEANTAPPAYSAYAIQNVGGRIDKITGNVKITAGAYAISNTQGSNLFIKNVTTYTTNTATTVAAYEREYYADFGIGDISGEIVIEATKNNYAILNNGRIGNITGKVSITADKGTYAIYNQTTTAYVRNDLLWPNQSTAAGATKQYHEEYVVARIGTIGGDDSEILIRSASGANNNYTIYNNGTIEAIINATIETTVGYNNMPTIMNTGDAVRVKDQQYKNLGLNAAKNWYDLAITRDYAYVRPTIGEIRGVTVKTPQNYALRNAGYIESITGSSFTAGTGYGIDNTSANNQIDGAEYARTTINYFHSNALDAATAGTPFATTTQYFGENAIWYTRSPAEIGKIDNVTITVESGNYGIQNAGIIDSITNCTIKVLNGNHAIGNSVRTTTGEDVRMMTDYVYQKEDGSYALRTAGEITDKVWYYVVPRIESIGEGNTISAVSQTIYNTGYIGEIGSATGKRTTITATGEATGNSATQYAIYNYQGLTSKVERLGEAKDTNTYTGAVIGIIHNVSINSQNSYAIYNIGAANTYHAVIGEIADGTEVTSVSKDAVYNHQTNAEIVKISGGIFTTGEGNYYAIYNNSTTYPIEIIGGYFKGGSGDRAHAIFEPDNEKQTRYTYPEDMFLSKGTKSATFASGATVEGYYYITKNVFVIVFNGNGGEGEMEEFEISLTDLDKEITLPLNGFTFVLNGKKLDFLGWAVNDDAGEKMLDDQWNGTVDILKGKLGEALGISIEAGTEITLYAVWYSDDTSTYTVTWGPMAFTFTRPDYVWDAENMQFVPTNTDYGWSADDRANTITVTVSGADYEAELSYENLEGYNFGMTFTGTEDTTVEDGVFTVESGKTVVIEAMLTGEPDSDKAADGVAVGTVTIVLEPIVKE